MNRKNYKIKADAIRWHQFSRRSDAVFLSLRREIQIGVLSVSTLLTATPGSAIGKMSMTPIKANAPYELYENLVNDDEEPFDISLLQEGDLLFNVVNQANGLSAAIVNVTEGIDLLSIPHVAIVCIDEGKIYALEASGKHGVWLNPIDSFIQEAGKTADDKPSILVGRLKDRSNIKSSVRKAMSYIGRNYDRLYMPDDKEIYCSELVQLSYTYKDGTPVFPQQPMSFHDNTGKVTDFWIEYYRKYSMTVPEGEPGTNPGGISRSNAIEIIYPKQMNQK